jgi:hypothetical protein
MKRRLTWLTALLAAFFPVALLVLDASGAIRFVPAIVALVAMGGLVASRRPDNRLGLIFLWTGLLAGYGRFAFEYAERGGGPWVALVGQVAVNVGLVLFGFILLLFPTGRLPSPGWRWLGRGLAVMAGAVMLGTALRPGPLEEVPVENPLGVEGAAVLLGWADEVSMGLLLLLVVASATSLILRFQHSGGTERQQLKWVAWAGGLLGSSFVVAFLWDPVEVLWVGLLVTLGFTAIPVAAGLAILRYRLYDIDLVINRTLVYGALTALLAGVYVAGVVGLPRLLPLTEDNDLVVAGSTLAVAALFSPLRRRLQSFVDRKFYRRRYDAGRTVEAFAARLRNEVNLDELSTDLVGVVRKTFQPAHVSVWLRKPGSVPR